jgi:hypothetical protein
MALDHTFTGSVHVERTVDLLFHVLQQCIQTGEGLVRNGRFSIPARDRLPEGFLVKIFLVLVVVAIETEKFPVAAVRRVVFVVMVFMMDRELAELFPREFAAAPRTDRGIELECLVPIRLFPEFPVVPGLGNDPVLPVVLRSSFIHGCERPVPSCSVNAGINE